MKNYTIFGERNSGTGYLAKVLNENLNLEFTKDYGYKHWFLRDFHPRGRSNSTTDNECIKNLDDSSDTLFIFTVRNPEAWVASMYHKPHHIKKPSRPNLLHFISNKYIAAEDKAPPDHSKGSKTPWFIDEQTNDYFIEEADNLINLRNLKNKHFYKLKDTVKYFHIIRQEELKKDLEKMVKKYDLILKNKKLMLSDYRKPTSYAIGDDVSNYIKTNINNPIDNLYYNENELK
jgi:hypothetical protein